MQAHDAASTTDREDLLRKIQALLAKAERTEHVAEAEAFTEAAHRLMVKYAIDEAMLAAAEGRRESIVQWAIEVGAPYATAKGLLLGSIATAQRCSVVRWRGTPRREIFGVESDVRFVESLFTSLLVQGTHALIREERRDRAFRHSWWIGFAQRMGERLARPAESVAAGGTALDESWLPVLVKRRDLVEAAIAAAYPTLRVARPVSFRSVDGLTRGGDAADRADIGQPRLGAQRALGPGAPS